MPDPEQCADVRRTQLEAFPVRLDGLARERGARERPGAQEVRLRLRGIECNRAVEAVERLAIAILLLEEPPEVEDREQEVRRNPDRFLQQELGVVGPVQLERDQGEQAHGIDIARVVAQDAAIKPLGLVDASLAMMLGGVRHHAPLGRALEASLEGGIRLLAAAEQGERLAEREPGAFERGIEPRRSLEEGQGVGRAARLHQQESQILRVASRMKEPCR